MGAWYSIPHRKLKTVHNTTYESKDFTTSKGADWGLPYQKMRTEDIIFWKVWNTTYYNQYWKLPDATTKETYTKVTHIIPPQNNKRTQGFVSIQMLFISVAFICVAVYMSYPLSYLPDGYILGLLSIKKKRKHFWYGLDIQSNFPTRLEDNVQHERGSNRGSTLSEENTSRGS